MPHELNELLTVNSVECLIDLVKHLDIIISKYNGIQLFLNNDDLIYSILFSESIY
jgi:hypothetical protein